MKAETFKILLVDDEPDILEILSYPLKNEGFQVYTASNGLEAIKLAKDIKPHLIVLDVMMPEMDGPTLYREVQARFPQYAKRFIFITGSCLASSLLHCHLIPVALVKKKKIKY